MTSRWWILIAVLVCSCTREAPEQVTLSFWHFWSEPQQAAALDSLITAFEEAHPSITINATSLAWSDGKQKLQMAYNASLAPDVVHIGADWFAEFQTAGCFQALDHQREVDSLFGGEGRLWTQNTRALLLWSSPTPQRYALGVAVQDPHNVLKRSLPILWQTGASAFYRTLPISASMNERLVQALWQLRDTITQHGIAEPSRLLDDRFLRGEIQSVWTGPWMIDQIRRRSITAISVRPLPSIRNGDVLAVSAGSQQHEAAQIFIDWLTEYAQAKRFCLMVSDAGYPADDATWKDSVFQQDPLQAGFVATLRQSHFLPISPTLLQIEPIVETLIEASLRASSVQDVRGLVRAAQTKIQAVETR